MDTAELAINKLIILSILDKIQGITLNQLTALALETLYMDYFGFVTAFESLCQDRLALESIRKDEEMMDAFGHPVTRCDLTQAGRIILATLEPRIPMPIRSYLAQACSGWQKDIRLKKTLSGICEPDANGFFLVRLKQNDGLKDLIDLRLTIPDKSMAQQICDRWKRNPQTVYLGMLSLLTGETTVGPDQMMPDSNFDGFGIEDPGPETAEQPEYIPADPMQQTLFDDPKRSVDQ